MNEKHTPRGRVRLLLAAGVVAAFGVLAIGLAMVLSPGRPAVPPPPSPNGYELIVEVAESVQRGDLLGTIYGRTDPLGEASTEELRTLVDANGEVLRDAIADAKLPGRVPIPQGQAGLQKLMDDSGSLRGLGRLMAAAAELHVREGRPDEAAELYAATIDFAQEVERGPVIDLLVGAAIERPAAEALKELAGSVSQEKAKELADRLGQGEATRATLADVFAAEDALSVNIASWYVRMVLQLTGAAKTSRAETQARAAEAIARVRNDARLATALLAARGAGALDYSAPDADAAWAAVQAKLPAELLGDAETAAQLKSRMSAVINDVDRAAE